MLQTAPQTVIRGWLSPGSNTFRNKPSTQDDAMPGKIDLISRFSKLDSILHRITMPRVTNGGQQQTTMFKETESIALRPLIISKYFWWPIISSCWNIVSAALIHEPTVYRDRMPVREAESFPFFKTPDHNFRGADDDRMSALCIPIN